MKTQMVRVPLSINCPLCGVAVGSGDNHQCSRADGSQCSLSVLDIAITVPQRDMVGKPKKRARR